MTDLAAAFIALGFLLSAFRIARAIDSLKIVVNIQPEQKRPDETMLYAANTLSQAISESMRPIAMAMADPESVKQEMHRALSGGTVQIYGRRLF